MELTKEQREDVRNFLISRGLAFKPLLEEMSDHVSCDLEERMNGGLSYQEAWKETINDLPENHFKIIQQETMETINKRFALSRVFTYVAMATMLLATIFKVLHLAGGSELVLASFAALAVSLITASVSGIYFNRDKKGTIRVAGIVAGTVLLMIGYSFKLLHLNGADQLVVLPVIITTVFMFINSISAFNSAPGNTSLFSFLHEKYSPGIERFLLILMLPMAIYSIAVIALEQKTFIPLISIVIVYGAALHFFALVWRRMEHNAEDKSVLSLIMVIAAVVCLNIPFLAEMVRFNIRLISVTLFLLLTAIITLRFEPIAKGRGSSAMVLIPAIMFLCIAAMKLGYMTWFREYPVLHVIIAALVLVSFFMTSKNYAITRTYFIIGLTSYLFELV